MLESIAKAIRLRVNNPHHPSGGALNWAVKCACPRYDAAAAHRRGLKSGPPSPDRGGAALSHSPGPNAPISIA